MSYGVVFVRLSFIVVMVLIGVVAKKANILDAASQKTISGIAFNIALPTLTFSSISKHFSADSLGQTGLLFVIGLCIYGVCLLFSFLYIKITRQPEKSAGVHQYCIVFSNVAFVGLPIIRAFWPEEALLYASVFIVLFSLFNHTVGAVILSGGKGRSLKGILTTPPLIGAFLGVVMGLMPFDLHPELLAFTEQIGGLTTPLAMFSIGITVASLPIKEALLDKKVLLTTAFRLVLVPLAVFAVLRSLFPNDYYMWAVPTLIAAMPGASTLPILAHRFGADSVTAGKLMVSTTLLALVSIPLMAFFVLLPGQ